MFINNAITLSFYRKARENGYRIHYGKVRSLKPLYERQDGTKVFSIVRNIYGDPEYGYSIFDENRNCYVDGCYNSEYDHLFTWQDVVTFVHSL